MLIEEPETHGWTHSICDECCKEQQTGLVTFKLKDANEEICCYCGKLTFEGIYIRDEPKQPKFCTDKTEMFNSPEVL